jgi:hypothetical protein
LPVIDGISVQGVRAREPANFADAGEALTIAAKVHDEETPADQLLYAWSATQGTFSGPGASVTWTAPASVAQPSAVTITLTVTEKYGASLQFQHSVEGTATLSLHDSVKEVGDMSRQFLLDFSDTTIKDANRIMQNFGGAGTCPDPAEVAAERAQVIDHYTFFRMLAYRVDAASVTVGFAGSCPTVHGPKKGDACAYVGVMWDSIDTRDNSHRPNAGVDQIAAAYSSIDTRDNSHRPNAGVDQIAAAYSPKDARWFLCSSDYDGHLVSNPSVAVRYPGSAP